MRESQMAMANMSTKTAGASGHTSGIFADMTLDGPEIGTLVVVADRAKNLPNRKTMGKQDPYCAMRLGKDAKKTDTDRRGGQTPRWDQELRFTVHDSPDYYKLKVSVFNDDKRTDLIGEAFISLNDLIKPGGGSNDLWHQLNYKGRYAGDIRMEMTYYDLRPREEKAAEKRRYKDKTVPGFGEQAGSTSGLSGPRQLGPREARRRPLPANPGTVPTTEIQPPPSSQFISTSRRHQPHQTAEQYVHSPDEPQHFPREQSTQPYSQSAIHDNMYHIHETFDSEIAPLQPMTPEQFRTSVHHAAVPEYAGAPNFYDRPQRRRSQLPSDDPTFESNVEYSSPSVDVQSSQRSESNVLPYHQPSAYIDEDELELDPIPPPPPKHRNSSRIQQTEYPPSSFVSAPLRPIPIRPVVEERSPLQTIEHNFNPNLAMEMQPPTASDITTPIHVQDPERMLRAHPQHYTEEPMPMAMHRLSMQYPSDTDQHELYPEPLVSAERLGKRRSFNPLQQNAGGSHVPPLLNRPRSHDEQLPQYHQNNSSTEVYNSGPHTQSMPTLPHLDDDSTRARPQKRMSGLVPPRKAVSPSPYMDDIGSRYPDEAGGRRLSGVPFGPGSYDVLNPASSEITNENTPFETPEQARYSSRLREARVAEDLGPIIDNDGRVIDPSDHLPTSSWAPEPERKQRKPEHVIHYRTKNDVRGNTTPASSPASLRMKMHNNQSATPKTSSPISAPPSTGRQQAFKLTPTSTRPLPAQPIPQPHVDSSPTVDTHNRHRNQRASYHESPQGIVRPRPSEYQVPIHNSYTPRGSTYSSSPQGISMASGGYSHNFHDPLAAEMSMIDIGPSRGGKTAMRMSRGY